MLLIYQGWNTFLTVIESPGWFPASPAGKGAGERGTYRKGKEMGVSWSVITEEA